MNIATFPSIPLDTVRAARAVFGRTNFYLVAGDKANDVFNGLMPEKLTGWTQKSSWNLAALYFITIFQFIETLPDCQAVDALRKRVDWKYALHLPLNYPELEPVVLCEFRRWLKGDLGRKESFQRVLNRLADTTDFANRSNVGLDTSQVITLVCQFNRLAIVWDTLRQAIEALATHYPEWLLAISSPYWFERYGVHASLNLTVDAQEKDRLTKAVGADGRYLLDAAAKASIPGLVGLSEMVILSQVWHDQFETVQGEIQWRKDACASCVVNAANPKSRNISQSEKRR